MPSVVIEMPETDRASPLATAMVDACSQGVSGGCTLAEDARGTVDAAAAVAIVTWSSGEHRVARIEVGMRRAAHAEWVARAVEFRAEDALLERWRSVGLVIATLVGQTFHATSSPPSTSPVASAAPPAPQPKSEPAPKRETPTSQGRPEAWWVDAGGVLGTGLDSGSWRRGGFLRGGHVFDGAPLFVTAGVRYAATSTDDRGVAAQWGSGSAGFGARASWGELRAEVRLELLAELTRATVDAAPRSDQDHRWVAGGRAGVDVGWMATSWWGLVAGADATLLGGGTVVRLRGEPIGRSPPLGFALLLGVRIAPR